MKNSGSKTLKTKDLTLRKFDIKDARNMFNNWATDIETVKFLDWDIHKDLSETIDYVEHVLDKYEKDYGYVWCIVENETNDIIGSISVFDIDTKNKTCELGYAVGSKWHGKGYGTQMLMKVLEYLKDEGFEMIFSNCSSENPASKRIMEKSGMKLDAILTGRLVSIFDNTKRADIYYYSYK